MEFSTTPGGKRRREANMGTWGQALNRPLEDAVEQFVIVESARKMGTGSGVPREAEMWTPVPVPVFRVSSIVPVSKLWDSARNNHPI